jgi:hypothetical protein
MKTMPAGVQRGFMKDTIEAVSTGIRSYTGLGSDLGDSKGRCLFAGSWLVVALKIVLIDPPRTAISIIAVNYSRK